MNTTTQPDAARVAVVTGASRGAGKDIAQMLGNGPIVQTSSYGSVCSRAIVD